MKKLMKTMSALLSIALIMCAFAGCVSEGEYEVYDALDPDEITFTIIGEKYDGEVYEGYYLYDEDFVEVVIVLRDDNTFRYLRNANGKTTDDVEGEYVWSEDSVLITYKDDMPWMAFNYKDETLENNGYEFKKR